MLNCRDVWKSFEGQSVLRGVDFRLDAGEIAAILGPSGAGKTTFLRLLCQLESPDRGEVEYDVGLLGLGEHASEQSQSPSVWPRVTMVFQQLFLWPHMSIRDNILFPLRWQLTSDLDGLYRELLGRLGIMDIESRLPAEVSQGQRQLASLARSLLLEPRCLLLDEVTSALDLSRIAEVGSLLHDRRANGTSVVLVTHLIPFARAIADRIVYLEHGGFRELHSTQHSSFDSEGFRARFNELL